MGTELHSMLGAIVRNSINGNLASKGVGVEAGGSELGRRIGFASHSVLGSLLLVDCIYGEHRVDAS